MSLRDLLKNAGILVRLSPTSFIKVVQKDRRKNETWFEVDWSSDYEGAGPEYGYMPPKQYSWEPIIFYSIPDAGEANPTQIADCFIDWDSDEWIIDPESWDTICDGMKQAKAVFKAVADHQDPYGITALTH